MNLGVDVYMQAIPERLQPGIGLRPGGERPDLEPIIPLLYAGLYHSIAAHARLRLNVVADLGHHGGYATIANPLFACARLLAGLPALFVGVRCDIAVIMQRRDTGQPGREGRYERSRGGEIPAPVLRWQEAVREPGNYDIEVDTTSQSAAACAEIIRRSLESFDATQSAFRKLAARSGDI